MEVSSTEGQGFRSNGRGVDRFLSVSDAFIAEEVYVEI